MAQDLDEMMQKAPTLTLDPFGEEKAAVAEKEPEPLVKEEEVNLSPEERRMVEEFAAKIDLHSSNMILQYGAGAQKKMADFSETALENVRTKDLGEVGEMLASVVSELRTLE